MGAVHRLSRDLQPAAAIESLPEIEMTGVQECEQSEGLDRGAGSCQAAGGHIETMLRQHPPRPDLENDGGAGLARHGVIDG